MYFYEGRIVDRYKGAECGNCGRNKGGKCALFRSFLKMVKVNRRGDLKAIRCSQCITAEMEFRELKKEIDHKFPGGVRCRTCPLFQVYAIEVRAMKINEVVWMKELMRYKTRMAAIKKVIVPEY